MKVILCFIHSHDLGDFFLTWADFLRQISTSGLKKLDNCLWASEAPRCAFFLVSADK